MNIISRIPQIQFISDPQKLESFRQSLKAGSEIYGRVLQSFGHDQYLVSMRGMNLIAESNVPLKEGERFRAKVQATDPRLMIKIADETGEMEKLSEQWNVRGEGRRIISQMLAERLPMTKEAFERVRAAVQQYQRHAQLKGSYEEIVRSAIKLEQLHLPPTLDNFKGALLAVKGGFDMAMVMSNLKFFLLEDKSELPAELLRFMQNLPARFEPQILSRNLPAAVVLLGLLYEAGLKELLEGKISRKLNLKRLMLALEKDWSNLLSGKSSGLNDLEALQMRNLPEFRAVEADTTYLQLPVYYQGGWERMDVFFRDHRGESKQMDKNNATIRINMDTRYLGKMSALTDIQNGALTIDLNFEQEDKAEFVQPFLPELQSALTALGYDVRSITASSKPVEETKPEIYMPIYGKIEGFNLIA